MMTSMTSAITKESKPVKARNSSVEEGVDVMTQTMSFVRRLFLILLCVRMLLAARLEKRAVTDDSVLRPKCPGNVRFSCAHV